MSTDSGKMAEKPKPSLLKQAALQIVAGGSAGFVEVCIMHPLDLVKTRLQIQNKKSIAVGTSSASNQIYYNGVLDCFRKMYQHEGLFSYWKGILPPILAETPKRATKFLCFEQYKRFFMFGSDKATPMAYSLAGLGAGATEAIIVNPFEVVKVNLQSNRAKSTEAPTTFSVARQIIKKDGFGLQGLNKGLTATIGRNGVFNMIYFGFYHSVKDYFPAFEDPMQEFMRKVGIGFVSGTIASIANIPIDVAKSRIQGPQPVPGQIKYRGTCRSMILVAREEGFGALYKGLLPKVMRLGPGGAIMLLVYEYSYEYLQERFLKYRVRKRLNPMREYDENEFKERFRFTKIEVEQLYHLIDGQNTLEPKDHRENFAIPGMTKLMIALRFYAVGSFYLSIGDMFGVSKSTVETIIHEVSFLISAKLRNRIIVMPETRQELLNAKVDFMRLSGFPICIAAVDGTHVLVQSFGGDDSEVYRNRKMVFSLNCQVAVSADGRVVDIVSRWPGSAHDSTIFTHSNLCNRLRRGDFGNDSVIVVDSAYPPERFICKPLSHTDTEREQTYQRLQIKARNVAERVNGQLKRRFPIIKYGMRFRKREIAQDVVVCCCILHNLRKSFDAIVKRYDEIEYLHQLGVSETIQRQPQQLRLQNFLIEHYFN